GTAYAASSTGMYKTTDNGTTWAAETLPIGITEVNFVRFNDANHALAGGPAGVLLRYSGSSVPVGTVTVTAPNGGENWTAGTMKDIAWTSSNVTNVKIEYTTNNGTTWSLVAASVAASPSSFAWTVPNTPATQCKVRISDASSATVTDMSDNVFTISAAGPVITWQHVINVKDNGNENQNLTFGLAPQATDGIDAALGEAPLPPAPPTGVFDGRLELPLTPPDYSLKDYRKDTLQNVTWIVKFQTGAGGYPVTLSWNSATLPAGSFTLKDAITGTIVSVDMKSQSSYILTNTGISALKIEYSGRMCKDVVLASGWNILSVPVTATSMATAVLFPAANSPAYGYNNNYVLSTTLALGKGYFLRYPQAATISICGTPSAVRTVPVNAGWNIIGAYDFTATVSGITTTPPSILTSPFYGYSNGYQQATALTTGKGYWVRASQAGTLNLPTGLVKEGDAITGNTIDKQWGRVIITDAEGKSFTLFTAKEAVNNAAAYELPPVPPAGVFDVRFGSNQLVELFKGDALDVLINSAV
ncbi:MAG: hypothetical protein HYV28_11820, partial [Ignavibacteriales bacterium]|nr:hypothetical protein [Ignavibacteriales bacterium]